MVFFSLANMKKNLESMWTSLSEKEKNVLGQVMNK